MSEKWKAVKKRIKRIPLSPFKPELHLPITHGLPKDWRGRILKGT